MAMNFKTFPRFMLLIIFMYLFITIRFLSGSDTISQNKSLSGDQTVASVGEVFVLGFFTPGNTSNYYVGMWYKNDPSQTILWVANREKPVSNRFSSELRISHGNLVLFDETKTPIWSTNVSFTSTSARAVLQDDGNIIVSDKRFILWQSFDHPTDTWLPGSKIGFNKITKTKQVLTSWKNLENPSLGLFTFELDPSDVSYITLWNRSRNYWTTGPWTGDIFTLVPEMRHNMICYFKFVSNNSETSFTMYAYNSSAISRLVMDVSGQMKQFLWLPSNGWKLLWSFPRQQCQVYAFCGAYGSCSENSLPFCSCLPGFEPNSQSYWDLKDYSSGCMRKTKLQCGNNSLDDSEKDRFLEVPSMSFPEDKQSERAESITECESRCVNKCSCTAYAYDDSGCSIWTGDLLNLKQLTAGDSSGRTLYIRLAASEFSSHGKRKKKLVGVAAGSAAGLVVFLGLILFTWRHRKKTIGTGKAISGGSLVAFGYRDLQNATKNFSEKLGEGGFGSVFKGRLADSTVIAVKKLESVGQGEKQFRTEVSTIGAIQHVNLVRLRGFCSQGTKKLLVYDYMANGSLDSHLFHDNDSNVLDWRTRYQIALGSASGLVYLHEKCRDCIIHCDIKPENILLDAEFCPKVADFGLAKLVGREFSRVLTTIRGTRGYLAPEWIAGVAITPKADVYSYGMMLFELISGRRNSEVYEDGTAKFLAASAASVIVKGGDLRSVLDPRLEGNADMEELKRVCAVSCWCIQDNEVDRPSMGRVMQILEGIIEVDLPPVPRSLQLLVENQESVIFFT